MAAQPYGTLGVRLAKGDIDLDTATVKALLVTSSYTQDIDTHDYLDDINATGHEVTGTNYTAGGVTVSGVAVTYESANNRAKITSDAIVYTNVTVTARGMILYVSTGTAGTSPLICYYNFGSDVVVSGANLTLTPHANGLVTVAV